MASTQSNTTPSTTAAAAVIGYLLDESTEGKLKDLFDFYDADGNGMIQRDELINVLALCAHEIGLEVDAYQEQIADAVFSNANLTPSGNITYESLREVLKHRPNLINELALAKVLHQNSRQSQHKDVCQGLAHMVVCRWDSFASRLSKRIPICNKLRWEYISNNLVRFNFFLATMFISLFLFVSRIVSYWSYSGWVQLARASGQNLNFFCSIIVLLVCRRTISLLRARGFGRYLPLDNHIYFHKMFGLFILGHSISHTLAHICNFLIVGSRSGSPYTPIDYMFTTLPGIGWIGGCASITGWFLLLIIALMSFAYPFSRQVGKFELFYYTHLLYIPFWALLFIHAPRFWIWFIGPFTVFFVESLLRLRNLITNLTSDGQTTIVKAVPLPSNVIHLVIKRPPNFEYNPGDWIYVLIPQIAKYEWHPFTISSAPEQDGVIWLHIRAVGEWTRSLRSYFEGLKHRNHLTKFIRSGQFSMSMDQGHPTFDLSPPSITAPENINIFIDGPYGSPSSAIFRAEHAVLIATGIGVTPFASILQSIVHHYEKRRQKCPGCAQEFLDNRPPLVCKLRKVDFVWINRDQKSFEWFIKLLAELELTQSHLPQHERFLDIHIHLTAIDATKTKSIGLQLALYLVHEKNKKDLVTGLRTRTKAGRPDWEDFFSELQAQKKGKVSVFFCGRPQLGRLLHRHCDSFGFKFRKEIF